MMRTFLRAGSWRRSESGQAMVEIALVFPLIASFIFGIMELSLMYYSYCVITECAREGTRYGMVHGSTCKTAVGSSCTATASSLNTYTQNLGWPNLGGGTLTAASSFPDGNENPGSRVQVVVTYASPLSLPFVPKQRLSMSSSSVMYILQ